MCWHCGSPITDPEPLGRSLVCVTCGKDLRVCRHCRHLRPSGCAESSVHLSGDKPLDSERANFCDWFSLDPKFRTTQAGEKKSLGAAAAAKSAFNDLFK